jgi:hypothetical protein
VHDDGDTDAFAASTFAAGDASTTAAPTFRRRPASFSWYLPLEEYLAFEEYLPFDEYLPFLRYFPSCTE